MNGNRRPRRNNKNNGPFPLKSIFMIAIGLAFLSSGRLSFVGVFALLYVAARFFFTKKETTDERKFNKYANIIGTKAVAPISAIAAAVDVSFDEARRDLQQMIDEKYFGQYAYIDNARGLFIADSRAAVSLDQFEKKVEQPKPVQTKAPALNEYQTKLAQIRKMDDIIQDEKISAKIRHIEDVTGNIFDLVQQKPDKRSAISTFMNYYLPTTLKLLEAYSMLERQSVSGENITKSKTDIEKTIDQLAWGFERQLDQMFESEARDISTDITVLERMMAQDGLKDNPYEFPKQQTATAQQGATASAQQQQQQ